MDLSKSGGGVDHLALLRNGLEGERDVEVVGRRGVVSELFDDEAREEELRHDVERKQDVEHVHLEL
jgi:hypothetical protein